MGQPKAWLRCGQEYLLQHIVRRVSEILGSVVVAARAGQELPPLPDDVRIVCDRVADAGPLAGIAAGLEALAEDCQAAFVVACDQPLLEPCFVARLVELLEGHAAVVPSHGGRLHPLTAVYRLETRSIVAEMLRMGALQATAFAQRCAARIVAEEFFADCDPGLRSLCNFNDPEGFAALIAKLGDPSHDG